MALLISLLNLLSRENPISFSRAMAKVAGCCLILLGVGMGFYFVFQYLAPVWGYFESGAFLCIVSLLSGILLLLLGRPKHHSNPVKTLLDTTSDSLKNVQIEDFMSPHVAKIIPFALAGGLILSQLGKLSKRSVVK